MEIQLKLSKDFERKLDSLKEKYGEDFEWINGLHPSQLDFSEFIENFVEKDTVADTSIDPNANVHHKDIRCFMTEKGKSEDKLFALDKIHRTIKKMFGLRTANQWLEQEFSRGFYLNDSATASYFPYCFSGDTEIMTKQGVKQLKDIVGQQIKVLNKARGWEDATVKNFGKQPLMELRINHCGTIKTIMVTPNHRWFIKTKKGMSEVTTSELKAGMRIPYNTAKSWSNVIPSPFGVAHGFFTGDGDKGKYMRANFCGDKKALIPYFTPAKITGSEKELTISGAPKAFASLPSLDESVGYLYGWLAGYFAADGCIDTHGRCTIASTKIENLKFVQDVLCVLGMPVNDIKYQDRVSNLTNTEGRVYYMAISRHYLRDDFFIRPTHREKWLANKDNETRERSWIVESVRKTNIVDDVYCAVTESGSFTLNNNVLTHNCWANDFTRLATEGLFFLNGYNNQAPKHLTTYFDDVIEFVSFLSNRQSGACGMPNVLIWAWYFWKLDCENGYFMKDKDYYLRQQFQKFIYRLNQPFLRIDQSAFTNISIFDRPYLESLFGGVEFPDGTLAIDHIEEILEAQKIFMEVVSEIREENFFTYPVLSYSLLVRGDVTKEELSEMIETRNWNIFVDEEFARWCSKHNNLFWFDSNFFCSDNVGVLSNCCRLLSDTKKLDAFINSIGGTALSVGSCRVSTINLVRIAYESGFNKKKYIKILRDRVLLDCKALTAMRHIIKRNIEKGLLPNYQDGAVELDKQFCTIGGIGMYEVMDLFGLIDTDELGCKSYSDEAVEFATEILDNINDIKDNFECDFTFNLEMIPAENCAGVICQADNLLFEQNKYFIYSNQWIPLMEKCTIQEKCRLGSIFDKKCGGGCIAHINVENRFPNEESAWDMLNYVASQGVIYFAFTPKISVCKHRHGFINESVCPKCGEPIADTYARVVGFFTPVSSYQNIRKREFDKRRWMNVLQNDGVMR